MVEFIEVTKDNRANKMRRDRQDKYREFYRGPKRLPKKESKPNIADLLNEWEDEE